MPSPQMLGSNQVALPKQVVITNRIIWGAMLMGQVVFLVVIGVILSNGSNRPPASLPNSLLVGVDAGMLAAALVATAVARLYGFRGVKAADALRVRYGLTMLLPMAFLDGVSFFGLVVVLLTRQWMPALVVPVIAMAVELTLFPRASVSVDGEF